MQTFLKASYRCTCLTILLIALVLAAVAVPAPAQTADADQAKALLAQGQKEFDDMNYSAAQATLLKVDASQLSQSDKKKLDDLLTFTAVGVRKQSQAMEAYRQATESLKNNNLGEAKAGFEIAAESKYLPPQTRRDARAQLVAVVKRMEAAEAAKTPDTKPATKMNVAPANEGDDAKSVAVAEKTEDKKTDLRRQKAEELVAAGKVALQANDPTQAAVYFDRALELVPDMAEAKKLSAEAHKLAAAGVTPTGGGTILDRVERNRQIAQQAARVDFEKAMKRSKETASEAKKLTDYDLAADAARNAKNVLESNKTLFTASDYRRMLDQVDQQLEQVQADRNALEKRLALQKIKEIEKTQREREVRERELRARRIARLKTEAKTLREQRRNEEAVQVLDSILQLDRDDAWAQEWKSYLQQEILLVREGEAQRTRQIEEQKSLLDIRESEIPWYAYLQYPKNWPEITHDRRNAVALSGIETEKSRQTQARLDSEIPKVDFTGMEFSQAIDFLREVTDVSIFVNWPALENLTIEPQTPLNKVLLNNVTKRKALELILKDVGGGSGAELSYYVDDGGVVHISTKDEIAQTTPLPRVYDIRDLIVRVPNFEAPRMNLSNVTNASGSNENGGGGGSSFLSDSGEENNRQTDVLSKTEMINKIITLIKETVEPDTWRPIGTGSIDELGGQLVITQTPGNHKKILDLINRLREASALQVAIEARFISVNSSFLNNINVDLDFYFNLGSNLGSTTVTDPWTGATVPARGATSGWGNGKPGWSTLTPIGVPIFGQNGVTTPYSDMLGVGTGVGNNIGAAVTTPALSVGGTFLDDLQVNFLIEATQASASSRSLIAPRVTLFNGQRGYVVVSTTQAYVSDLTPVVAENATSFDPTVSFVPTGSVLEVEATVSADRRYVTMTLTPQVSVLNGFTLYNISDGTGFIQLPNVTVQEISATVSVPDGGTLLIGGQKTSGEIEREEGVPLLNKIPVLNRAFSNRGFVRDEETLLILVKPTIILQREQEMKQFPGEI